MYIKKEEYTIDEINVGNKIIANFLEFRINKYKGYNDYYGDPLWLIGSGYITPMILSVKSLKFNSDWGLLMLFVRRMRELEIELTEDIKVSLITANIFNAWVNIIDFILAKEREKVIDELI